MIHELRLLRPTLVLSLGVVSIEFSFFSFHINALRVFLQARALRKNKILRLNFVSYIFHHQVEALSIDSRKSQLALAVAFA